ncbi:MAG: hypothetical protein K0R58_3948, partial [Ramlibacter sp.]|nr:hypothetical protein [Ramlibacter sp.]
MLKLSGRRGPARSCASSFAARSQAMLNTSCAAPSAAMRSGSRGRALADVSDAASCAAAPCKPPQKALPPANCDGAHSSSGGVHACTSCTCRVSSVSSAAKAVFASER